MHPRATVCSSVDMEYTARLPLPTRTNRTYKAAHIPTKAGWRTVLHTSAEAKAWRAEARTLLALAGFRPLPKGTHTISLDLDVTCAAQRDIDAGLKLLIDAIADALGTDDRYVSEVVVRKTANSKRDAQSVVVRAVIC